MYEKFEESNLTENESTNYNYCRTILLRLKKDLTYP